MAVLLGRAGHRIVAVSGRGPTRDRASRFLSDVPFLDPADAARAGEFVLDRRSRRRDPGIVEQIAAAGGFRAEQWVAHLSGASGLGVLAPARAAGARPLAIHPLQTFPDVSAALDLMPGCAMAVTADDDEGFTIGERIADDLMARPFRLDDAKRPLYHAAAVFASNYLIVTARHRGGSVPRRRRARPARRDAARCSARAWTTWNASAPAAALTGPAVRGDAGTIERNLEALRAAAPDAVGAVRRALSCGAGTRVERPAACRTSAAPRSTRCSRDGADPRGRRSHGGRRRTPVGRRRRRAGADDGGVARRPRVADTSRSFRARHRGRVDLREPEAVRTGRGPVPLSARRSARRRSGRIARCRRRLGAGRGCVLSAGRRAHRAGSRSGRRRPGGGGAAGALRGRADRRPPAVRRGGGVRRVLRREGCAAALPGAADGRTAGAAEHGRGLSHGPRARRTRALVAQRLPVARGARTGRLPVPRALRGRGARPGAERRTRRRSPRRWRARWARPRSRRSTTPPSSTRRRSNRSTGSSLPPAR